MFLFNSKPEIEYSDFITERFKYERSTDSNDNLKIILKALRSQHLKLTNIFTEFVEKLYEIDNRFTAIIDEQNTPIKKIINDHSQIHKHPDEKIFDSKTINSRVTDHVSESISLKIR